MPFRRVALTLILFSALTNSVNAVNCGGTTSCGCTDTVTSDYNLTSNLKCAPFAFTIGSDNITIDCQGHNVSGFGFGNGFLVSGRFGVGIRNCSIRDFSNALHLYNSSVIVVSNNSFIGDDVGVFLNYSRNSTVADNTALNCVQAAVYLLNSTGNNVTANNMSTNSTWASSSSGVYLRNSNFNEVSENTVQHLQYGVYLLNSAGNAVRNNTLMNYSDYYPTYGIFLSNSANNTVLWNTLLSVSTGIFLATSNNNTVGNNIVRLEYGYGTPRTWTGIDVAGSRFNALVLNRVNLSGDGIIFRDGSSNNTARENTLYSSGYGLHVLGAVNNTVENNTFRWNYVGIYVENSSRNRIAANVVENSSTDGLRFADYISEGASNNNVADDNRLCYNGYAGGYYDLYNGGTNSGSGNTCNRTFNWNDTGTVGCRHLCGATILVWNQRLTGGWNLVDLPIII
ncbi:Periplasmic copper-binding protein (NosD) [uncultured archaeon]|nr:Periplasmic copper-binding protein (NosD) [uncultured archaeon]